MVQHESEQPAGAEPQEHGGESPVRTVRLIAGEDLLTLNPVDGSEIEPVRVSVDVVSAAGALGLE